MNDENMRITFACTDQDALWVIDEIIYGLYSINKTTFEVKCIIDSKRLFRYGNFKPYGLFIWKEEYIVIIPVELHKKWVIYNKITGQIEYKKVMEEKYKGVFIGIDEAAEQAYFCPVTRDDPITVIDLKTFRCIQALKFLSTNVFDGSYTVPWKGISSEKYILFPVRGTRYIVRLNYGSDQVKFIESDITEGIADIGFYFGELWVLPMEGEKIYKLDEEGKKIACVELTINYQNISASEIALIVVQKNYVFLLPYHQHTIFVYDKSKRKMIKIAEEGYTLPVTLKTKSMVYWAYYIENNKICFLPFQNKFLQVDLDRLSYEQKDLCYPQEIKRDNENFYYIWNHVLEFNDYMIEIDKYSPKSFFDYIQNESYADKMKTTANCYGEKIWSNL